MFQKKKLIYVLTGDGPELRDYVTDMGIVEPLLRLVKTDTPVS